MPADLLKSRRQRRAMGHGLAVLLSVTFYLVLVPVIVIFSGPLYTAVRCTLGTCEPEGTRVSFVLSRRGPLQIGSPVSFPNGERVGRIIRFEHTGDERYTTAIAVLNPSRAELADAPLRCHVSANFNLQMNADLIVSTCPDQPPPTHYREGVFVCGVADHFQRIGQEIRHFVIDNVRPGSQLNPPLLTGPCGADNEADVAALRAVFE